ncbi:Rhodanese-related sulfurtransferase [Corynebacterium mustelae]|uniref:Rhodanese-related sulfurtransferase n=1 Tax=Corynebacterium mustelae TaxID=571915 RepID=A0A0G3GWP9_9CORY|nr:rhodanese-like domain-containing protein [Corynebacterium mustelae]AKK05601.1 Rhodanese-related sulfurtransferase [Corynebacterium mustelae]
MKSSPFVRSCVNAALIIITTCTLASCGSLGATADGSDTTDPDFSAAIDNGATIIDVRSPAEYDSGHIPGAVNFDVDDPEFGNKILELDQSKEYAVYCRSGNRSSGAIAVMELAGFSNIAHLDEGLDAWNGELEK